MWTDGRMDRHDEANSRFLQFCERGYKRWIDGQIEKSVASIRRWNAEHLTHTGGPVVNDDHKLDFFTNRNLLLPFMWQSVMIDGQAH